MSSVIQRSFAGGEIAPALHARADLARYAIGLKTCRNMVVMRAGGATKRPGTRFVTTAGSSPAFTITIPPTLTLASFEVQRITATITDALGRVVTGQVVTWGVDDASTAAVVSSGDVTADVTGGTGGTTNIRARVDALGIVSAVCVVTVQDSWVIHVFSTPGDSTLEVTAGSGDAETLIVAGGGSGGSVDGTGVVAGGGGGGGIVHEATHAIAVGSLLARVGPGANGPAVDASIGVPVVQGNQGGDSEFDGTTATGGGGGGAGNSPIGGDRAGGDGGSGGGGGSGDGPGAGGSGTAGQGNDGGAGTSNGHASGGGGGGAGAGGTLGVGGLGAAFDIESNDGTTVTYARGGDSAPGLSNNATGIGDGGSGGGDTRFASGGNGASGRIVVKYLASTGIVATGGTKTVLPVLP